MLCTHMEASMPNKKKKLIFGDQRTKPSRKMPRLTSSNKWQLKELQFPFPSCDRNGTDAFLLFMFISVSSFAPSFFGLHGLTASCDVGGEDHERRVHRAERLHSCSPARLTLSQTRATLVNRAESPGFLST